MKNENEFIAKSGEEGKLCSRCREYNEQYNKQYRKENADKIREQEKQYRKENVDKIRKRQKQYRKENADKIREIKRQYRKNNAKGVQEFLKQYRKENVEKLREHKKQYCEENRAKIKEYYLAPAKFSTYACKLTVEEAPICGEKGELLVKCAKCKKYFLPTTRKVRQRVSALQGSVHGESIVTGKQIGRAHV